MVSSIWLTDRTLSGATSPGQSGTREQWRDEGVTPYSLKSPRAWASLSDGLMLYPGHSLEGGLPPSPEMQSVYCILAVSWVMFLIGFFCCTQSNRIGIIFKQIFNLSNRWDQTVLSFQVIVDPGSNGNKGMLHNPQNCNCNIRCSLMLKSRHSLFWCGVGGRGGLILPAML